jgi:hypothetical protein
MPGTMLLPPITVMPGMLLNGLFHSWMKVFCHVASINSCSFYRHIGYKELKGKQLG